MLTHHPGFCGAYCVCVAAAPPGFTSIIEKEQLVSLCEEGGDVGLPNWEDFKDDLVTGNISFPSVRVPFLFAGE